MEKLYALIAALGEKYNTDCVSHLAGNAACH